MTSKSGGKTSDLTWDENGNQVEKTELKEGRHPYAILHDMVEAGFLASLPQTATERFSVSRSTVCLNAVCLPGF